MFLLFGELFLCSRLSWWTRCTAALTNHTSAYGQSVNQTWPNRAQLHQVACLKSSIQETSSFRKHSSSSSSCLPPPTPPLLLLLFFPSSSCPPLLLLSPSSPTPPPLLLLDSFCSSHLQVSHTPDISLSVMLLHTSVAMVKYEEVKRLQMSD